jgi:hypothetical protein
MAIRFQGPKNLSMWGHRVTPSAGWGRARLLAIRASLQGKAIAGRGDRTLNQKALERSAGKCITGGGDARDKPSGLQDRTEADHLNKCPVCGALLDMRDIAQVLALSNFWDGDGVGNKHYYELLLHRLRRQHSRSARHRGADGVARLSGIRPTWL